MKLDSRGPRSSGRSVADVAPAGAYIEQRRNGAARRKHQFYFGQCGAFPSEQRVRSLHILHRPAHYLRIDERIVENLDAASS